MKIYNYTRSNAYCYKRIIAELQKYAPSGVEFVDNPDCADMAILHVNGRFHQFTRMAERFNKYIVMQYCLRSTRNPKTDMWKDLWENSHLVFSYYDLNYEIKKDCGEWSINNFMHSPLGADETIFHMDGRPKESKFTILTCGDVHYLKTESILDIIQAASRSGLRTYHLGDNMSLGDNVTCEKGISDESLSEVYRSCRFVSGLRHVEGFEMPAVEGIFCGARPILFDTKNYRQWYEPWAEFIPEDRNVVYSLTKLFDREQRPITMEERREAVYRFNWKDIVTNFWKRV